MIQRIQPDKEETRNEINMQQAEPLCFADAVEEFDAKITNESSNSDCDLECAFDYSDYNDSDEWDTDLDEEITEICRHHDSSGVHSYKSACSDLSMSPSKHIIQGLQSSALSLRYKSCGPKDVKAFKQALMCNTNVRALDLEGNNIEVEGLLIVKQILQENVFLTELNLAENNFGSAGAGILCDILKETDTLRSVDFKGNRLQDKDMVSRFHYSLSNFVALYWLQNKVPGGVPIPCKALLVSSCYDNNFSNFIIFIIFFTIYKYTSHYC